MAAHKRNPLKKKQINQSQTLISAKMSCFTPVGLYFSPHVSLPFVFPPLFLTIICSLQFSQCFLFFFPPFLPPLSLIIIYPLSLLPTRNRNKRQLTACLLAELFFHLFPFSLQKYTPSPLFFPREAEDYRVLPSRNVSPADYQISSNCCSPSIRGRCNTLGGQDSTIPSLTVCELTNAHNWLMSLGKTPFPLLSVGQTISWTPDYGWQLASLELAIFK